MFFFVFFVHPSPSHEDYGTVDGAAVSCWVNDPVEALAETAARALIEEEGWDIDVRDQAYPLAEDHYAAGESGFAKMQQARTDGICAVFHTWNVGAPDE